MVRSNRELALEPEETDSQYGMRRVSKKHLIVLFVVILILLKVVSVRREHTKQAREKLKQEEAAGEGEQLPEGGVFLPEGNPQKGAPPKKPAQKEDVEKRTPPSGVRGVLPVQPTAKMAKTDEKQVPAQKVTPPLPAGTIVQPQFPELSTVGPPPAVRGTGHVVHPIYPGVVSEQR